MRIRLWGLALAVVMLSGVALAACGGGGGSPATDEEYVKAVCTTVGDLQTQMSSLTADAASAKDVAALQKLMDNVANALDDAADSLDKVNPPADVKDAHKEVVQAFRDAAKAMKDGDTEALNNFDPGNIAPDEAVQARLSAAARNVDECNGLGLFDS